MSEQEIIFISPNVFNVIKAYYKLLGAKKVAQ